MGGGIEASMKTIYKIIKMNIAWRKLNDPKFCNASAPVNLNGANSVFFNAPILYYALK